MRKTFAAFSFLAALLPVILSASCGRDQSAPFGEGGSGESDDSAKLEFEPSVPLQLAPQASAILEVRISPPQVGKVRFGIVGDSRGEGSLSADETTSGADGRARVTLYAPRTPGSFRVRAEWDDPITQMPLTAERPVVVGSLGFGAAVVTVDGWEKFNVREWRATCFAGTTCADLESPDGSSPLYAIGTPPLTIDELPAGTPLAIVVTGGQIARGCATAENLGQGEVRPVDVAVSPLPFETRGKLPLKMVIQTVETAFLTEVQAAVAREFPPESGARVWLDVFSGLVPIGERVAFTELRSVNNFDSAIEAALEPSEGLFGILSGEISRISESLAGEGVILGRIDFDPSTPSLHITSCAGVPADTAVIVNPIAWEAEVGIDGSWSANSNLLINPLAWLRDVAYLGEAAAGLPVSEQLGALADCTSIAESLVAAAAPGDIFPGCDVLCAESLCHDTFGAIWQTLGSSKPKLELRLAESGTLSRDDSGALTGINGTFLAFSDDKSALTGTLTNP
jgi:hypothetical protein